MMGKKKKKKKGVKKTKEEVLLAETPSTTTTEAQTPRKRGRPRKIIITEKTEDEKDEQQITQIDQFQDFVSPNSRKAAKPISDCGEGDNKEKKIEEMVGPSSKSDKQENFKLEDKVSTKQKQFALRRSRTRRKSKPTKSS
ncbi:hypothetical protein ACP275_03G063000 [Erythranthe tilingii]